VTETLTLDGTLHLVVAWASGKSYVARWVKMSEDVAAALKSYATDAVARLSDPTPYAPDSDMEDSSHMEAPRDESLDTALIAELSKGPSLEQASPDELRRKPLTCHALVVQGDVETTLFVRKRTPIQLAKKSLLATLFNDTLDELESPLFAFDNRYDVIITSDKAYVLDKKAFERLFKESPAVLAKTMDWIAEVTAIVPFADGSAEELNAILKRNSVLRNKFLAVKGKAYLSKITPDDLRTEMVKFGMHPEELMEGDTLKVTGQNAKDILRLLNEDLFSGGFSNQHYAASNKRTLT
jgi:hypothetical protein